MKQTVVIASPNPMTYFTHGSGRWLTVALAVALGACGGGSEETPAGGGGAQSGGAGKNNLPSGAGGTAAGGTGSGGVSASDGGNPMGQAGAPAPKGGVVISEIMFHPVLEDSADDLHEFIELTNAGTTPAALGGWKLGVDGKERFVFPAGTNLAPKAQLVIAKNKAKLLAVAVYALKAEQVVGDYTGELDNGGATLSLLNGAGEVMDTVKYDDRAPWPLGADALGAGEDWLPKDLLPLAKHKFMGRSMERWNLGAPGSDPRNWEASPVDGATPGRPNTVTGEAPAIVLEASFGTETGMGGLKAKQKPRVTVKVSEGKVSDLVIESREDPAGAIGTMLTTTPLAAVAGSPRTFSASLPAATTGNTVIRYRVLGKRDKGNERLWPRATDPMEFYAGFVEPDKLPDGRAYHMFIEPANWTAMWTNLTANGTLGPNAGCKTNPTWDDRSPATFVVGGKVYDVRVRYTGSRYQRKNGVDIKTWTVPGPAAPLKSLSWRVAFPKYDLFENRKAINLNKQYQACPGVLNALEGKLWDMAGIKTNSFRFARLHVNGAYYNYVMEVENIDETFMQKVEGPGKPVGDLFKANGSVSKDDGLWGKGDWTPVDVNSTCPAMFSKLQRYQATYERQTHGWKDATPEGHAELIKLIDDLNAIKATADNDPKVRAYFEANFDVKHFTTHVALRNWVGVWDDGVHNFYPYKRPSDGKWIFLPQDFDLDFGGDAIDAEWKGFINPPTLSFFHPDVTGGKTAGNPWMLKVQFIKAFRKELAERVSELGKTVMAEANVNAILDDILAKDFSMAAWLEAPVRRCELEPRVAAARTWIKARHAFFAQGVK